MGLVRSNYHTVGTQILVHGFQTPKSAKGLSCSVDGHPPLTDDYDIYLCNATVPLGQHNLTITNLAMNLLTIDYFLITPVANSSTSMPSTSSSNPNPTTTDLSPKRTYNQPFRSNPSPTTPSMTTLSSPTTIPSESSEVAVASTTASSRSHGTLIGGTVGGLALLVVVVSIMGFWFVKWRRRANRLKAPSAMFVNSSKSLVQIPHSGNTHQMYQV